MESILQRGVTGFDRVEQAQSLDNKFTSICHIVIVQMKGRVLGFEQYQYLEACYLSGQYSATSKESIRNEYKRGRNKQCRMEPLGGIF